MGIDFPNNWLGSFRRRKTYLGQEDLAPIIFRFVRVRVCCHRKKITFFSFLDLGFDTLKKGGNFRPIRYFMNFITLCLSLVLSTLAFVRNGLVSRWREDETDGGFGGIFA